MLDDFTKKRINTLRQILVGKLPDPKAQVEQITNGLIYKFMNDMDEQSVSMGGKSTYFSGKFQKYSWKNLMDTKTSGVEKIKLYSDAIEQMYTNENLPELFREIFKNSFLPFKDPSTLNMFLKEINEFHYSNSEKLGDAFEYLLSFMGSQGDAGQFRTPRHIIDFITEIVNPQKNETVLDPACGTAGFLISTYKHILKQNTKKNLGDGLNATDRKKIGENLNGYDISPDMVKMSLVNMYLHKFTNPKINEYDTLSSEEKWNEYYDVILANPPFFSPKGGITPHNRFGVNSTKAEVLFIDYINEHLKPNGRAGIIIPEGIIFQNGNAYKNLRKKLIQTSLAGIISLPAGVFNPYSAVKTSILILDKKIKNDKIFFARVDNDGYTLGAQRNPIKDNDLPIIVSSLRDLKNIKENTKVNLVNREDIINSENINFSINFFLKTKTKSNYKIVKLSDVLIDKPIYGSGASKIEYDKKVRYVRITDIDDFGNLKLENAVSPSVVEKQYFLDFEDILFARSGSVGRCYVHKQKNGNFQYAGYLIKFPLNKSIINPNYLFYITRSNYYSEWISNIKKQGTISNINAKEYSSFEFPLPTIDIQNEIVNELSAYKNIIDGCNQVIENYIPTIDIDLNWKTEKLSDVVIFKKGQSISKSNATAGNVPVIAGGKTSPYSHNKSNRDGLTITISSSGAYAGYVNIFDKPIFVSDAFTVHSKKEKIDQYFLYFYLKSKQKKIYDFQRGAAIPHVYSSDIQDLKIPIPSLIDQKKIVKKLISERDLIEKNKSLVIEFEKKISRSISKVWKI